MSPGERVKELRKKENLTLQKFGEKVNVSATAISRIENGHRNLTGQLARSISMAFNVNEEWLLSGKEPMRSVSGTALADDISKELDLNEWGTGIVRRVSLLSDEQKQTLWNLLEKVLSDDSTKEST